MDLKELQEISSVCRLCELHHNRNKAVFAKGDPFSSVMVCGMCPGPDENEIGIPFVGAAGKVLDDVLVHAFSGKEGVYVTNLVKCFVPPGTRLKDGWMHSCLPYFISQINIIRPKVILALGKDVCNFLLNRTEEMKNLRGKTFDYIGNIKLISTYHPSYLARGGGIFHKHFKLVVDDFKESFKYI